MLDFGLYFFYFLCVLAIAGTVGFAILHAINTPGALLRSAIAIGALLALFGVAYALSSSDVIASHRALGITGGTSKIVGAGLIMFYIVIVLAFISLLYSEISKAFK